jgi:hypothetical protein
MRAGTSQENLLYVGDGVGGVIIYDDKPPGYPVVGILNEPSIPGGQCVDAAQDVFIPDSISDSRVIYEYAHGSTEPMQILGGMHDTPLACSIDPKTGNLAVLSQAGVYVYRGAKGKPVAYPAPDVIDGVAYDTQGDLIVDGSGYTSKGLALKLWSIPAGKTSFQQIAVKTIVQQAGSMFWSGTNLIVADRTASVFYEFKIAGQNAKQIGTTPLKGAYTLQSFFVFNGKVIVPSFNGYGAVVGVYAYPKGGAPTSSIDGVSVPLSAAVSAAARSKH